MTHNQTIGRQPDGEGFHFDLGSTSCLLGECFFLLSVESGLLKCRNTFDSTSGFWPWEHLVFFYQMKLNWRNGILLAQFLFSSWLHNWIFHGLTHHSCLFSTYLQLSLSLTAKKLPKNEPQGGAGPGGRLRGGVDLQEAAPQGRSGQCCGGGN